MLGRLARGHAVGALDLARHEQVVPRVDVEDVSRAVGNVGELERALLALPFGDVPLLALVRFRLPHATPRPAGVDLGQVPAHGKLLAHAGRIQSHEIPTIPVAHRLELPQRVRLTEHPEPVGRILKARRERVGDVGDTALGDGVPRVGVQRHSGHLERFVSTHLWLGFVVRGEIWSMMLHTVLVESEVRRTRGRRSVDKKAPSMT